MTRLQERLDGLMRSFDERDEPFSEASIYDALRELNNENLEGDEDSRNILLAEHMAFGFHSNHSNDRYGWGTYYGPMMVWPDEKGQLIESPSIQMVTQEMLSYWLGKASSAVNPLVRIRYADLVWDFTRKVTNNAPDIRAAHIVVDATIELIQNKAYKNKVDAIHKLERSLSIALSIGDQGRIEAVKNIMLTFEDEIAEDGKPGLWGFCFDNLFLNKKVPLSEKEKEKIINDLEERLTRLTEGVKDDYGMHAVEAAVMRLAGYYRNIGELDEMRRVLRRYGSAVAIAADSAGAIAGLAHLQHLHGIYNNFGMREDADKLSGMITELGKRTESEMHEISHTISIPTEKMEKYLEALTAGSLEEVLIRIAVYFIPESEKTTEQVSDLANKAPLTFLISHSILDSSGRPIAQVGSIEEDFDGRVILQLSQNMQLDAVFLREVIKRTREKFSITPDMLLDYLYQSPVFQTEYKSLVSQGLNAYLHDDHVSAAHILIPQIENVLRRLLEISGGAIYKQNRVGGLSLRILDEILRDKVVIDVLTENVVKYLRVLMVDQRGWNIRNDVCHGMMHPERLNIAVTDRLFHVIILLSLLRENDPESSKPQE
jgi:hypothetical protein